MLIYKLAICIVFIIGLVQAKPGLKQGGAACYPEPNYCQNGGTCYTQYTQQPVPVTYPTTTSTQEACVQPTTTPEQCIPPVVVYTTTQRPTQPPTTTQYVWVTQPVCGCQPQYVGDRCEQPATQTVAPVTTTQACIPFATEAPVVVTVSPVNGCAAVQCLNGGSCQEISIQPYGICICGSEYTGARCETPIAIPSTTTTTTTASTIATFPSTAATTSTAGPYGINTATTQRTLTHEPHCNFTIRILNDGAFTARMRVGYVIDGVQQPLWTSANLPIIGNTAEVTIPWYSTDIVVSLERLGFNWAGIVQDTGINSNNWCTKCYKVWGDVSNPKWDYTDCA